MFYVSGYLYITLFPYINKNLKVVYIYTIPANGCICPYINLVAHLEYDVITVYSNIYPTTNRISLLLPEAKVKPRPRCNYKNILRVSQWGLTGF